MTGKTPTAATRPERVFVAVGNDLIDGSKTLDWTLRRWNSHPVSPVILHFALTSPRVGKLPPCSVSEEKLETLRRYEQNKTDDLLSKYMERCGRVKAEILTVEENGEPIHNIMVNLVSELRITKLVIGISVFIKSSSRKSNGSKSAISRCFYLQEHKAEFCELFVICGGKRVHITQREHREYSMVGSFLGKFLPDNSSAFWRKYSSRRPSDGGDSRKSTEWEIHEGEIEDYLQQLQGSDLDAEVLELELQSGVDPVKFKSAMVEERDCSMTDDLEVRIKEEFKNRTEVQKHLEKEKEHEYELIRDVEESKKKLSALSELKSELSKKLQISNISKASAEAQLERSAIARAELVRETEELRRQRDVFQRRIDFCREKDAIGMLTRMNEQVRRGCMEYGSEDIRLATEDFSQRLRLKCGGDWVDVYKGRINHVTVVIEMLHLCDHSSPQDLRDKVKLLSEFRHPHLVAVMGFCSDPACIISEYMHNGNLGAKLLTSQVECRRRNRLLRWHDRIRIAHEVSSGLGFLHLAQLRPIAHGHLDPSNVLLDRNLVSKINCSGLIHGDNQHELRSDVQAFGVLLWQLLVGRNWGGLTEELAEMDSTVLALILDEKAGRWPLDLAEELARTASRCIRHEADEDLQISDVIEQLGELKKKADDLVAKRGSINVMKSRDGHGDCSSGIVLGVFLCPITKEVMRNPHIAADGFSYELEAMEEWLNIGRDTSPMTNLRLKHKLLTPNHNLRNLIQEWHTKGSS